MIGYYICPVVDDGAKLGDQGYGKHPKVLDYLIPGTAHVNCAGMHPNGWTVVRVEAPDLTVLEQAPDVDDLCIGLLGTPKTAAEEHISMKTKVPGQLQSQAIGVLRRYNILSNRVGNLRQVVEAALREISPNARLEHISGQ